MKAVLLLIAALLLSASCPTELIPHAVRGEYADFADFLKAGGTGRIFRVKPEFDYTGWTTGDFLLIDSFPDYDARSESGLLFLRDDRLLLRLKKKLADGAKIFLSHQSVNYDALAAGPGCPLMRGVGTLLNDRTFFERPSLVITRFLDEYLLHHEEQHQRDATPVETCFDVQRNREIRALVKSAVFVLVNIKDDVLFQEFIGEQRADVAALNQMKADLETRKTIAVRVPGTDGVAFQPFEEYVRAQIKYMSGRRLGHDGGRYGTAVYALLRKLHTDRPDLEIKARALLAALMLPSEELSLDKLLPPFE